MSDQLSHGVILDVIEQQAELTLEAVEYRSFSPGKPFKSGGLSIPETANNRAALGSLFDVDGSDKNRIIKNVLFENDSCAIQGSLVITGQSYENRINTLTGFFISGSGLLWLDFADTNLRELDWSAYEHELTIDNVLASETPGGLNDLIVYDVIDRGKFIDHDRIDIIERYPAFNVAEMLKNIFKGYDLKSNFLTASWFTPIYQIFTGTNEIRNDEDWKETALINVGKTVVQAIDLTVTESPKEFFVADTQITFDSESDPNFDNGNNFAYNVYTVPQTGTYRFVLDASASMPLGTPPGDLSGEVNFTIYRDAVMIAETTYTILNQPTNSISNLIVDTDYIELTEGDEITCYVNVYGEYTGTMTSGQIIISTTCLLYNQVSRYYGYGSTVKPSELLPDIKVNDFLRIVFEHFGIIPQYSVETNIVRLNVWERKTSGIDLSMQLDPTTASAEFYEAFNYEMIFKSDSADKYGVDWFTRNENETGAYKANNGAKVFELMQSYYSNTVFQKSLRLAGTPIEIPVIWSEVPEGKYISQYTDEVVPEWKTACNYRLLIYNGNDGAGEYYLCGHEAGVGRTETLQSYAQFLPYTEALNIEFADRNGLPGLHSRLHSAFIARINNGITLTIQGNLTANFLTNLINNDDDVNLTKAIYIGFEPFIAMWTIQRITTNGIVSQLQLIRNDE